MTTHHCPACGQPLPKPATPGRHTSRDIARMTGTRLGYIQDIAWRHADKIPPVARASGKGSPMLWDAEGLMQWHELLMKISRQYGDAFRWPGKPESPLVAVWKAAGMPWREFGRETVTSRGRKLAT